MGWFFANQDKTDADTIAIRDLIQRLFEDERVESSLIPIGDGLHLGLKTQNVAGE